MPEIKKGTVFGGRFTVQDRIGAGGMATVYRALDRERDVLVAVKIVDRDFLKRNPKEAERNLRRFKREAAILQVLAGAPHVVGFIDHGCSDAGDWYIAMELLEGEQLRHYIKRGKGVPGLSTFLHYGVHLVRGVQEIHARNFIHRDLAPDNVIVVKDDKGLPCPKFLDFGIGKSVVGELEQVTQLVTIMGKPQYFSPEQARGADLTPASDIYSLGVILYELATGRVPIEIRGVPDFPRIQKEAPKPISSWPEGKRVPLTLQHAIMACLDKDPARRPALEDLLRELESTRAAFGGSDGDVAQAVDAADRDQTLSIKLQDTLMEEGETLGRYEIRDVLGRGGMGAVYLAWDPVLHREVAIKVASEIEEETARKAILREARASSALRCPNIVTIYDAGTEGGVPYIAMEYVKGETLADIIEREGPIAGSTYWEIASGIIEGLHFAQDREKPVIHRDLKPANILVGANTVKITDFGIAQQVEGLRSQGDTAGHGLAEGTAAVMSPEQAGGKSVDGRSDIYSLGCVLYQMTTGRPPFQGNAIAVLYQHCTVKPESPLKVNPNLTPRGLEEIILKCLEKEPDDRYQTPLEILEDLRALFAPEDLHKPWWKSPITWAAAAVVVASVTAAILFSRSGPVGPESFESEIVTVEGLEFAPDQTWYVRKTGVEIAAITSRHAPLQADVEALENGEPGTLTLSPDDEGRVRGGIRLPVTDPAQPARFRVTTRVVGAGDDLATRFDLVYDPQKPVVEVRVRGGDWHVPGDFEKVLRQEDLEVRISDPVSGLFMQGGEVVHELIGRLGDPAWEQGESVVALDDDGRSFWVSTQDQAGNEMTVPRTSLRFVIPTLTPEGLPKRTREGALDLVFSATAEGFDLKTRPLQDLEARVEGPAGPRVTLSPGTDGRYRGTLPLPEQEADTVAEYVMGLNYAGQPLAGFGTIVVTRDLEAPDLDVTWDQGSIDNGDGPGRVPRIYLSFGKSLSDDVSVRVGDGPGGARNETLVVTAQLGDLEPVRLDVPDSGLVKLPSTTPADQTRFSVVIVAKDDLGNTSTVRFEIELGGARVTAFSLGGREPTGSALSVPDGSALPLVLRTTGLEAGRAPFIEVLDGEDVIGSVTLAAMGEAWGGTLPDLPCPPEETREYRVLVRPAEGLSEVQSYAVTVDRTPPQVSVSFPGLPGGVLPEGVLGHFPEIRLQATDAIGLRFEPEDLVIRNSDGVSQPERRRVTNEANRVELEVKAPPGPPQAGTYELTFATHDLAGNPSEPVTRTIRVVPPQVVLGAFGGRAVPGPGHFTTAEPRILRSGDARLTISNNSGQGVWRVTTSIQRQGEPEGAPEVQGAIAYDQTGTYTLHLPPGAGLLRIAIQEVMGTELVGTPQVVDELAYVVDQAPPDWQVLVGDREMPPVVLQNEGLRDILDLASVRIVVRDSVGLPPDAVSGGLETRPYLKLAEATTRQQQVYGISAPPDWTRQEVDLTFEDAAGNESPPLTFTIHRAKDRPELETWILAGREKPHSERPILVGDPRVGVRVRNDAPSVTGVAARVVPEGGRPGPNILLTPSAERDRWSGELTLPADGLFTVELLAIKGSGNSASTEVGFESQGFRVDTSPPRITRAGADPRGPVADIGDLAILVEDAAGLREVSARLVGSDEPVVLKLDAARLYHPQTSARLANGLNRLEVTATDQLDHSAQETISFELRQRHADPAEVTARTGLQFIPIPNGEKPRFWLSKHEVTVGQFRKFANEVDLGALWKEHGVGSPFRSQSVVQEAIEATMLGIRDESGEMPVRHVREEAAWAYATWAGGRVPTPEEWKGAAGRYLPGMSRAQWPVIIVGGDPKSDQRLFTAIRDWALFDESEPVPPSELDPLGAFGLVGMAGNVAEWTYDASGGRNKWATLGGSFKWPCNGVNGGADLNKPPFLTSDVRNRYVDVGLRILLEP